MLRLHLLLLHRLLLLLHLLWLHRLLRELLLLRLLELLVLLLLHHLTLRGLLLRELLLLLRVALLRVALLSVALLLWLLLHHLLPWLLVLLSKLLLLLGWRLSLLLLLLLLLFLLLLWRRWLRILPWCWWAGSSRRLWSDRSICRRARDAATCTWGSPLAWRKSARLRAHCIELGVTRAVICILRAVARVRLSHPLTRLLESSWRHWHARAHLLARCDSSGADEPCAHLIGSRRRTHSLYHAWLRRAVHGHGGALWGNVVGRRSGRAAHSRGDGVEWALGHAWAERILALL